MTRILIAGLLAGAGLATAGGTATAGSPCPTGLCLPLFSKIHQHGPLYNYGPYSGYPPFEPYGPWNQYLQYQGGLPAGAYGPLYQGNGWNHGHSWGHKAKGCSTCGGTGAAAGCPTCGGTATAAPAMPPEPAPVGQTGYGRPYPGAYPPVVPAQYPYAPGR